MTGDAAFWVDVYERFADMLDVPAGARQAHLEAATAGRPEVRAEVLALLAAHEASSNFLPEPPTGPPHEGPWPAPADVDSRDAALAGGDSITPGTMAGPWRLLALLGEGGMGRVFRAERADGAYTQQVAIKLTRLSLLDREAARRFRAERAILAGLSHPSIVRLLDGGTLPSGQAWLAMDLVEGRPISQVARDEPLTLVARLGLFRQACAAVHYAHQHGVVHRDLKPQNVLVGTDGAVKVVDFGVAKLLDTRRGDPDASVTGMTPAPLTPNYASPEQLRGLPVTTASDVYALGVLLYELLAGAKPYETTGKPLDEVLSIVLQREPGRPSAVLGPDGVRVGRDWPRRGDLDAIVLKAMAKAPQRRFASAAELEADVGRYLDARPVQAQEASFAYVAARLVRRHVVASGAVAVALVAVLTGLGVSLWQTRVAQSERARAEARLAEVRQLANTMVFKVHDAVALLSGSTPVRETIVREALGYLERLSKEPGDDPTLRLELAEAYTRVGRVLGDPQGPNLGDRDGAAGSFMRAAALGHFAARLNTSGFDNVAVGLNALTANTTAGFNTAVGAGAMQANTTGGDNTALGRLALSANTTGGENTAVGAGALGTAATPDGATAVGYGALAANVSGGGNSAFGLRALAATTLGSGNTALGTETLSANTTGATNTAVGSQALGASTTANGNTAVGRDAMALTTTGSFNTAVGANAFDNNATGTSNVVVGYNALVDNVIGDSNVAIGANAGSGATGFNNIFLGADVAGVGGQSNTIRIGNTGAVATFIRGISGATSSGGVGVFVNAAGQLGTLTSSGRFKEQVASLGESFSARMQALRPVSFVYKPEFDDGTKQAQYGLIAEEVADVFPELVVRDADGQIQTVRYHFLAPLLLAEVQRLERERAALAGVMVAQSKELAKLRTQMDSLLATTAAHDRQR